MNKFTKTIVYTISIIATILIITGFVFYLKQLMDEEDMLNVADEPGYYKVVFNLNGASMIEHKAIRCKIKDTSCTVTLPKCERKNGIVLGYSDNKDDLEAKYLTGETITLTSNTTLYAISQQTNRLKIEENNVDYLEDNEVICNAYNSNKSCKVIVPKYNKVGYENKGYSASKESLTGYINAGDEIELSKDMILYPIYSTSSRHRILNISKVLNYNDSFIEIENGCSESVYNEYIKYLDDIKENIPFLLIGNKIAFVTDSSFNTIWGSNYVGMNYGPRSLRSVDIRCTNVVYNDYYATMVHEMAHSWDFYYANRLGANISSQNDIINLYDKYKNSPDRPFRDYSYSNIYEFLADMMRYYYFKYNVPRAPFNTMNYPNDLKKALEKYMCISKNNYDESKCK